MTAAPTVHGYSTVQHSTAVQWSAVHSPVHTHQATAVVIQSRCDSQPVSRGTDHERQRPVTNNCHSFSENQGEKWSSDVSASETFHKAVILLYSIYNVYIESEVVVTHLSSEFCSLQQFTWSRDKSLRAGQCPSRGWAMIILDLVLSTSLMGLAILVWNFVINRWKKYGCSSSCITESSGKFIF